MIRQAQEQDSMADLWLSHTEKLWEKHRLKRVKEWVNGVPFQIRIEKLYSPDEGRPAEDAGMLFRCLLLAQGYGPSDRQLEEALEFRMDFRQFAGLPEGEAASDPSPFAVFRRRIQREENKGFSGTGKARRARKPRKGARERRILASETTRFRFKGRGFFKKQDFFTTLNFQLSLCQAEKGGFEPGFPLKPWVF